MITYYETVYQRGLKALTIIVLPTFLWREEKRREEIGKTKDIEKKGFSRGLRSWIEGNEIYIFTINTLTYNIFINLENINIFYLKY